MQRDALLKVAVGTWVPRAAWQMCLQLGRGCLTGLASWGQGCHAMYAGQSRCREVVLLGVNRVGNCKGKSEIHSMTDFFGSSIHSETLFFSANKKRKILFK